jgi:hypothetical protein
LRKLKKTYLKMRILKCLPSLWPLKASYKKRDIEDVVGNRICTLIEPHNVNLSFSFHLCSYC